jgi:hypothetical protein
MAILNLTPHDVVVFHNDNNTSTTFPRTPGFECRLETTQTVLGAMNEEGCEAALPDQKSFLLMTPQVTTGIKGLPQPPAYDAIIVSAMVGEYLAKVPELWRGTVISPDTSPESCVRDVQGRIVGVRRFVQYK